MKERCSILGCKTYPTAKILQHTQSVIDDEQSIAELHLCTVHLNEAKGILYSCALREKIPEKSWDDAASKCENMELKA